MKESIERFEKLIGNEKSMKVSNIYDTTPPVFENLLTVVVFQLSLLANQPGQAANFFECAADELRNVGKNIASVVLRVLVKIDEVDGVDY